MEVEIDHVYMCISIIDQRSKEEMFAVGNGNIRCDLDLGCSSLVSHNVKGVNNAYSRWCGCIRATQTAGEKSLINIVGVIIKLVCGIDINPV